MRPRTFQIRGWPAVLMLGVLAVVAVGIIALLLMLGAVVAVVGLGLSAVAGLYYAMRRKLTPGVKPRDWQVEEPRVASNALEVREIEVEVLPQNRE